MRVIGYFLGAIFGAALVFFLISFIFLRPRNIAQKQVKDFVGNSDKILIKNIPLITVFDIPAPDERLGLDTKTKTTYFSNRNMEYVYADTYTYFSEELNKYVRTYYITSNGANFFNKMMKFGKNDGNYPMLYFYYNKSQNTDPSFGTIDKPLPILFFESSDPIKKTFWYDDVNQEKDVKLMNNIYENNVKLYLQYFIEKEDFKKLFPNS